MPEIQKAKQIIDHHEDITILASPEFVFDSFPAALALCYSLKKLGKNVNLINQEFPEKYNFLVKEKLQPSQADFLITVKENGSQISQVAYERTDKGLNIFLKTKNGQLKKEDIKTQNIKEVGLLITIGINSFKVVNEVLNGDPKTIINIDKDPENDAFGDVNIVKTNALTFSKIVFSLIEELNHGSFNSKITTALLAGTLQETEGLQSAGTSEGAFRRVKFLLEKGADLKAIIKNIPNIADKKGLHLLGRSILNSKLDKEKGLVSVILTKQDFKETNSQPADLKFMLRKINSGLFPFPNFVCLWEQTNSPTEVLGVIYSKDIRNIEKFYPVFCHQKKGNAIIFRSDSKDINQTKDKVLKVFNQKKPAV